MRAAIGSTAASRRASETPTDPVTPNTADSSASRASIPPMVMSADSRWTARPSRSPVSTMNRTPRTGAGNSASRNSSTGASRAAARMAAASTSVTWQPAQVKVSMSGRRSAMWPSLTPRPAVRPPSRRRRHRRTTGKTTFEPQARYGLHPETRSGTGVRSAQCRRHSRVVRCHDGRPVRRQLQ